VSRWKSPQTAARRAERAAEQSAQSRKEKRQGILMLIGIATTSLGLMLADYLWMRHAAQQRHDRLIHHAGQTNSPISTARPGERD